MMGRDRGGLPAAAGGGDGATGAGGRPRVVIVGAGFGGLQAAKTLAGEPVDVVVVDRHNYHGFWPLLYQVGAGQVEAGQVAYPVRTALHRADNVRFLMLEVERVDRDRKVVLAGGRELPYDFLILAAGSRTSYLGVDGAREHTLPFKTLDHALAIRSRILGSIERAAATDDAEERRALLTFTLVGGGPTGVELAGALAEMVRWTFSDEYPTLDRGEVRILLLEALDRPLPTFSERSGRYTEKRLRKLGVEVRTGAKVAGVEPGRILLDGGEAIRTGTIVWTAGVEGSPIPAASGLSTTRKGTVPVDPHLRAEEDRSVFVVGDLAHVESDGEPLPMVAQVATQQARTAASNVVREVRGKELQAFSYTDLGTMAVIGRGRAVVERRPLSVRGLLGWPIWAVVHIGQLVGFRNRVLVLANWAATYIFSRPGVRLILGGQQAEE